MPERLTVKVGSAAELITVTLPEKLPALGGVNVTAMVHVAPPASVAGQLFAWPKPALAAMLVMAMLELVLFVSVTDSGELVSVSSVPAKVRLEGFSESASVTMRDAVAEAAPLVAVTVTGVALLTAPAVTRNVCVVWPAATVTDVGTGRAAGLALVRFTEIPPAGAIPLSVTVPVAVCPDTTDAGLKESVVTTGAVADGETVSPADMAEPLGSVAVMLTLAAAVTASVVTLKAPLVAPPAMLKLAGTVAAVVLLLVRVTRKPAAGAGPLRITVPTELLPPVSEPGLNDKDASVAGLTVKVLLRLFPLSVAFT